MTPYILTSIGAGVLFVVMDVALNVNPLARRLHEGIRPIARTTMNPLPAILIDLSYGFLLAALYLLLRSALPGATWFAKAASFALIVWFLRVAMGTASQWVMFALPARSHLYDLAVGALEMAAVSALIAGVLGA